MTISVGDKLPDATLVKATAEGPQQVQASEYFAGKKVALFSVPGAFTPTCSAKHLPGFVEKASELKAKGIDEIVGTAVNDAFVMGAWNSAAGSDDITMLADGNAEFVEKIGLTMDGSGFGMGSRRDRGYGPGPRDGSGSGFGMGSRRDRGHRPSRLLPHRQSRNGSVQRR